jgi:hypothetical protein
LPSRCIRLSREFGCGYFASSSPDESFNTSRFASRASAAESSMDSGRSCCSTYFSTPIRRTRSTSPGRAPKASRLSTCAARCSSVSFRAFAGALTCAAAAGVEPASRAHASASADARRSARAFETS